LFNFNPGFQSRFDKIRIEFPPWDGRQSADALVTVIEREGKSITQQAKDALVSYFDCLSNLDNWASARDVMELIKKNLEIERAARSYALSKQKRLTEEMTIDNDKKLSITVARGNASKQAQSPPIPYELEDVTKVFKAAIASRGGSVDNLNSNSYDSEDSYGKCRTINTKRSLDIVLQSSAMDTKLLVLCVTDNENCEILGSFATKFRSIANTMDDCTFIITDDPSIKRSLNINRTPTIRIMYKNESFGDDVVTDNINVVINEIRTRCSIVNKMKLNSPPPVITQDLHHHHHPPPPPPNNPSTHSTPPLTLPLNAPVLTKQEFLFKKKVPDNESDDDKDDDDDINVWAALEEACAELGWTQKQVKSMLENETNFPPSEILTIIIRSTGCNDTTKIKRMLRPQRIKVLEQVIFSIKESERIKSDEENKVRCALEKIGKCCMGYEWIKLDKGGGYICAGGSHYCTDDEVNQQLNDMN
jgi:hypothetical protein